jgi:transcriptional regulator of acetoin/glycerol metabolism
MTDSGNMNGSDLLRFVVAGVVEVCREHPGWSAEEVQRAFLPRVHAEWGGDRYDIPKVWPDGKREAREALLRDAADATFGGTRSDVANKHGVSRWTLYRLMKARKG